MVKPSTRVFWKEARSRPGGSFWEAVHGLFYMKWPELYISVGLGRHPAARMLRKPAWGIGRALGLWGEDAGERFADTYHGKVMPLTEMTRLIRVGRPLRLEVPEKVLPYHMARDIILDNPGDLVLLRCPCRATAEKPCEPLDVCIIVGRPFSDFLLEHHPDKTRRITVDEAVDVVRAEQKRGHVSHAFFKEAALGRFYAICNCCACCCGALEAHRQGTPMLASSGYVAVADPDACSGCGGCAKLCAFSAIAMQGEGKGEARPAIDEERCLGCGICAMHCKKKAIRLERDPSKPAPLRLDLPEHEIRHGESA